MGHPYRIREIAAQAGLSPATVDRVLHNRPGVRESTIREVHRAIADLDRRQTTGRESGRTFPIEVVVPRHLGDTVRAALEGSATVRARLHPYDGLAELAGVLEKAERSRAAGMVLTAPEEPFVVEAIARLAVPVVTLGTDLPSSKRVAYAGVDQLDAGATAAYLIEQWMADRAGDVLLISSGADDPRWVQGFRAHLPYRRIYEVFGDGVRAVLEENPAVRAVYAMAASSDTVEAFAATNRRYDVFVAHGLDRETATLLRDRKIAAVLHHDLRLDLRNACLAVMRAQGALPDSARMVPSTIQVVTPFNIPAGEI